MEGGDFIFSPHTNRNDTINLEMYIIKLYDKTRQRMGIKQESRISGHQQRTVWIKREKNGFC